MKSLFLHKRVLQWTGVGFIGPLQFATSLDQGFFSDMHYQHPLIASLTVCGELVDERATAIVRDFGFDLEALYRTRCVHCYRLRHGVTERAGD